MVTKNEPALKSAFDLRRDFRRENVWPVLRPYWWPGLYHWDPLALLAMRLSGGGPMGSGTHRKPKPATHCRRCVRRSRVSRCVVGAHPKRRVDLADRKRCQTATRRGRGLRNPKTKPWG